MRCAASFWLVAVLLVGCDPTVFDGLRGRAPVYVLQTPGGAAGVFGTVVVPYVAQIATPDRGVVPVSRFVVTGGENGGVGSAYFVYYGFAGIGPTALAQFEAGAIYSGCTMGECPGGGHGVSVAAFPEWRGPGGLLFHGCLAVPSPETGDIHIRCEDGQHWSLRVAGPDGERFGASAAGISVPAHDLGVAIFGAPEAGSGTGRLYRLPGDGGAPIAIDLTMAAIPADARLGSALAVSPVLAPMAPPSTDRLVVASWMPSSGATSRVLVAEIEVTLDVVTATTRACIERTRGYGAALALGDLDDDGTLDLAVGTDPAMADVEVVDVYDLDMFPASTACGMPGQPTPAVSFDCTDVASPDVPCDGTPTGSIGFGAALAIGDVDGDGVNDLIVGAPLASPRGRGQAGAVATLGGVAGSLSALGTRHAIMWHSMQPAGGNLGAAVAALPGRGRDEIVAGAPRGGQVAIFLCSGLPGDSPETVNGQRGCLPPI